MPADCILVWGTLKPGTGDMKSARDMRKHKSVRMIAAHGTASSSTIAKRYMTKASATKELFSSSSRSLASQNSYSKIFGVKHSLPYPEATSHRTRHEAKAHYETINSMIYRSLYDNLLCHQLNMTVCCI